jgi:hypothetical protein
MYKLFNTWHSKSCIYEQGRDKLRHKRCPTGVPHPWQGPLITHSTVTATTKRPSEASSLQLLL